MKVSGWKDAIVDKKISLESYDWIDGILIQKSLKWSEETVWRQSEFASRSVIPYTTTWCEQQIGQRLLSDALDTCHLDEQAIVMDLGCGDGRYVNYFLKEGFERIVALNYEIEPLQSLYESLSSTDKKKVFLICCDIMEHPLKSCLADFVLAWGLFTSTPDFLATMNKCIDILKEGGYLFNAEPILEQALLYALVMDDPEEFERTFSTGSRPRMWNEKESRYRVLTQSELRRKMKSPLIENIKEDGVSVFPSLLFGGTLGKKSYDENFKERLWQILQEIEIPWYRQVTFLSKKL